jgi:hypothetical protein
MHGRVQAWVGVWVGLRECACANARGVLGRGKLPVQPGCLASCAGLPPVSQSCVGWGHGNDRLLRELHPNQLAAGLAKPNKNTGMVGYPLTSLKRHAMF